MKRNTRCCIGGIPRRPPQASAAPGAQVMAIKIAVGLISIWLPSGAMRDARSIRDGWVGKKSVVVFKSDSHMSSPAACAGSRCGAGRGSVQGSTFSDVMPREKDSWRPVGGPNPTKISRDRVVPLKLQKLNHARKTARRRGRNALACGTRKRPELNYAHAPALFGPAQASVAEHPGAWRRALRVRVAVRLHAVVLPASVRVVRRHPVHDIGLVSALFVARLGDAIVARHQVEPWRGRHARRCRAAVRASCRGLRFDHRSPLLERPTGRAQIVVDGHEPSPCFVAAVQLARARSLPGVTCFFGPCAFGRMSKSKIAVGM